MRFQPFANSWNKTTYGEISSCFSGGTPQSRNPDYYGGSIPFIRSGEIHGSTTDLFLSENGLKNSAAKLVNIGDVLLALYGATSGQIARSQINGAINQAILCIRPSIDPDFLIYSWQAHAELFLKTYLQGGQGNLSAEIYKSLPVYVPSKAEQVKVSSLCRAIDQRISVQNKIIEDLFTVEKLIIDTVFGQESNSSLSTFIDEIAERNKANESLDVYSVSNKLGFIPQSEQFEDKEVASDNRRNYKIVAPHTFAYNPARINVGSIGFYSGDKKVIVSPMYVCFKVHGIDASVLEQFFQSNAFYKDMSSRLEGSVRQCLTFQGMRSIRFHAPSDRDKEWLALAHKIRTKRTAEERILNAYKTQKRFLLGNMFI